jgi:hypothetical protein
MPRPNEKRNGLLTPAAGAQERGPRARAQSWSASDKRTTRPGRGKALHAAGLAADQEADHGFQGFV